MCSRLFLLLAIATATAPGLLSQTAISLTATPANVSFTYQIGATALPAPQAIAIKRSGSGNALDFTATVTPASPWLIVTPLTAKTGTSVSVRVNPTSLIAGTYAATITFDAGSSSSPITAGVVLIIKNPPPLMTVAPATLTYQWKTDDVAAPAVQSFTVSTDSEPFSFTAVAAGGTWLTVSPAVGVVLSGSPIPVKVTVSTAGLTPGSYTGKITVASTTASNKTLSVTVNLTVNPGTAILSSIWPNASPIGSNDILITIRGSHLFKGSVVKATTTGSTDLVSTWISTDVMLATVPKALLTAQGTVNVTVVNSPQPASSPKAFTVTPPGPQLQTVANAASFSVSAAASGHPEVAPGEIISIFGSGMGPATAIVATPTNNAFPTSLGAPATTVEFEINNVWVAAPLIFVQANLVNCQIPFTLPTATNLKMRVTYNSLTSASLLVDGVASDPGLFTVDSSGRGQAAALNYDTTTLVYSLNSASNPVPKGGVLILYLTGTGAISPTPNPEGQLSPVSPLPTVVGVPSVTIGGDAASVISATAVPGALGGLTQLNVTVPATLKAAKDHAVVVVVHGNSTPATATIAVK